MQDAGILFQVAMGLQSFRMNFVEAGICSSHSRSVGVGPQRSNRACIERPHRIDDRMIVRVQNVLFVLRMARDMNLRHAISRHIVSHSPSERIHGSQTRHKCCSHRRRMPQSARSTTSVRNSHSVICRSGESCIARDILDGHGISR